MSLSPQQYDFIELLLGGYHHVSAGAALGIHRSTAWGWWHNAEVQGEYRRQRRAAFELTTGRLQTVSLEAVEALYKLIINDDLQLRRQAANDLLKHLFPATAQSDHNEARELLDEVKREREHAGAGERGKGVDPDGATEAPSDSPSGPDEPPGVHPPDEAGL